MKKRGQKGAVIILALLGMSLFMIGAIGLAIDVSYLYSHRQMAQVAADSAAQAAIMSVLDKTNVDDGTCNNVFGASPFSCTANSDCRTPCRYARYNGFGVGTDDVYVEFPASVDGVTKLSSTTSPNLVTVTVTRDVETWLMRMVGAAATSKVRVKATAAVLVDNSPIPILVLHPYLDKAFQVGGTQGTIKICGGPARSIQVNSCAGSGSKIRVTTPSGNYIKDCGLFSSTPSVSSVNFSGSQPVDLSKAGPADSGTCTTGTGADFGNFGSPTPPGPPTINVGTTGRYLDPASPIPDPLIDVAPPAQPAESKTSPGGVQTGIVLPPGDSHGCPDPAPNGNPCHLYLPGYYANGFQAKQETALMAPGVYYMGSNGFANATQGDLAMATCNLPDLPAVPGSNTNSTTDTGCGMLVYNTGAGDGFQVGASGTSNLLGTPICTLCRYQGILFFQDRNLTAAQTKKPHKLGGLSAMQLIGTIYLVNNDKINNPQTLDLQGNSGNNTQITGEIIVDLLKLGGGGSIVMTLSPSNAYVVRKVALVR